MTDRDEEEFEDQKASLEEMVEKKFRNTKLEVKVMAFLLRRDCGAISLLHEGSFTLEPFKEFFKIIQRSRMTFPKDIFLEQLKDQCDSEQYDIYKNFAKKLYSEKLEKVSNKNIENLCRKLKDLWESREIMRAVGDVVSNLDRFNLSETKKNFSKVIYSESSLDSNHGGDYLDDYMERRRLIQEKKDNPKMFTGIPTGIMEFDKVSGGLQRGEFGIIIAGTGVGKSIALGNFSVNAWLRGYNVMFVSLEMTKAQVQFRMDSRLAKISHTKFRTGNLDKNDLKFWKNKMKKLIRERENFLHISCLHRGCCAMEIEEEALRLESKYERPVDIIFIDYINLMTSNANKGDKRDWKSQAEVGWDIKGLSMDYGDRGIPIWTANQITDEGAKAKKLETYHLKYARGISEVAPVIVAMSQSPDDALQDIMKMWILKCRDFQNNKKPIILHPKYNLMVLNSEFIRQDIEGIKERKKAQK